MKKNCHSFKSASSVLQPINTYSLSDQPQQHRFTRHSLDSL